MRGGKGGVAECPSSLLENKCGAELIQEMKGTPWQPDPPRPGSKFPLMKVQDLAMQQFWCKKTAQMDCIDDSASKFRRLHEYVYTDRCPGWRHLSSGIRGTRDHSKACLDRIVQQIEDDTTSVGTQWKEMLRDEAWRMRQHGAHEGKVQS